MYRLLVRILLSNPTVLFGTLAVVVVVACAVAFVMSERRARRMAALAEDDEIARSQRKRLAAVVLVGGGLLALSAWWVFVRVYTEPDRVLVALRVEGGEAVVDNQWWHGDEAAYALSRDLGLRLGDVGLEVVEPMVDGKPSLAWAQASTQELVAAARREQARWVVDGRATVLETIELPGSDRTDYVMRVEVTLIDAQTGERFDVDGTSLRTYVWGRDPSDAVALNAEYLGGRLAMPLVAVIAAQPVLAPYREAKHPDRTIDETLRADRLARLFARERDHTDALARRQAHRDAAEAEEPKERASAKRTRLGDALAEEFVIGTAFDGRLVVHADPKHVSASPDRAGYVITNEGENFSLLNPDGSEREVLFEHYNIYGVSDVSADGEWIWVVLANHGASKTLGAVAVKTGELTPVLTHPTEYFAVPQPSPDGSSATFLLRPGRHDSSALWLVERDTGERLQLADAEAGPGSTSWSPDGASVYAVLNWPTPRIVRFDPTTGEAEHVLGETPEAYAARLEHARAVAEARATLVDVEMGLVDAASVDVEGLSALVAEADGASGTAETVAGQDADQGSDESSGIESELAALLNDPVARGRFIDVAVNFDGSALFVTEVAQQADGSPVRVVGRYELESGDYVRLEPVWAERLLASPVDDRVAVTAQNVAASPTDRARHDDEIVVVGPGAHAQLQVTQNDVDDEVTAWSRDGAALFSFQRGDDPGSRRTPVARIYRHDFP